MLRCQNEGAFANVSSILCGRGHSVRWLRQSNRLQYLDQYTSGIMLDTNKVFLAFF